MSSEINDDFVSSYESRKALHKLAPSDEKDLSHKYIVIPKIAVGMLGLLLGSCRNVVVGFEEQVESRQAQGLGSLCCFWHCNILMMVGNFFRWPVRVLISEHSDGELIAQACLRIGASAVRGSSTRGGARALVVLRKLLLNGDDLALTPDGPRGPAHVCQPGAIILAAKTGVPIIPVGVYGDNFYEFSSWDKFRMPKPFSNNMIRFGEPISVDADAATNLGPWQELIKARFLEEELKCKRQLNQTMVGIPRGGWTLRRSRK